MTTSIRGTISLLGPTLLCDIELGRPLEDLDLLDERSGRTYEQARLLVRLHGEPLGLVDLHANRRQISASEWTPQVWNQLAGEVNRHLHADGWPMVTVLPLHGLTGPCPPRCEEERDKFLQTAPLVSVIVPTHDRPKDLQECLQSLLAQRYPRFEVTIVDNGPSSDATQQLVATRYGEEPRVRYLYESQAGASRARNRGVQLTQAEYVAFTDDDVILDPNWLAELMRGFTQGRNVGCVTGAILPRELETPSQQWFEEYGGFHKGFVPRLYDLKANRVPHPLYPYTAGAFGSGASMAFQTRVLRKLGGFDEALGPPAPARGGEDLAAFFDVVASGYQLAYAPRAVTYHRHRREYPALKQQLYAYGTGLTAYLTRTVVQKPTRALEILAKLPYGLFFALSPRSRKNANKHPDYPAELTKLELLGMLCGPWAYLQSLFGG